MRYYNLEEWCMLKGLEYKPLTEREFIDKYWRTTPMAWTPFGPLEAKTKGEFERWWNSRKEAVEK